MCEIWYHVSCDPLISDAQYDSFVDSPTDDPWFCSRCTQFGDAPALPKHIPADKALNCLYLNAQSIFSKRLDLAVCLTTLQYDIVAITESFLDNSITDSLIVPPSYVGFRRDHNRHGGGILVLVRDNLTAVRRPDLESDCELLWLELFTQIGPVLFGTFCRSPNSDVSALNSLNYSLLSTQSKHPIVLCGDFNLPHINWSMISPSVPSPCTSLFCSLICDNYLTQLVNFTTRKDSILDLIFVNNPNLVSCVQPVDNLPGTDHDAIQFSLAVALPKQATCSRLLHNYKKADFQHFCEVFESCTVVLYSIW